MPSVLELCLNPQLKLSDNLISECVASSEVALEESVNASLLKILELRAAAQAAPGTRLCVFSMPKSASSFVQSSIRKAFRMPYVPLISTSPNPSAIGANPRQQELDELAIIFRNIVNKSYVAQHHTKASPYTCMLLQNYGIVPIVCIRNISDCLVSFLDMIEEWLSVADDDNKIPGFIWDISGGSFPFAWQQLHRAAKLDIIIDRWAKWYLDFFVSWKRAALCNQASPLFISYEHDILNGSKGFVEKMKRFKNLNQIQEDALTASVENLDPVNSRFNKGISGRGAEQLSADQNSRILRLAQPFLNELTEDECQLLFSASIADIKEAS